MSLSRIISKKIDIILILICIILTTCLIGAIYHYETIVKTMTSTIASKDSEIQALREQVSELKAQIANMQELINDYKEQLSKLDEYRELLAVKDSKIQELQDNIKKLQEEINNYEKEVNYYKEQVISLRAQVTYLQHQLETLKAPQLHEVNFSWTAYEGALWGNWLKVTGIVFNSGLNTAKNAKMVIWISSEYNSTIIYRKYAIELGGISGKNYVSIRRSMTYEGHLVEVKYQFVYDGGSSPVKTAQVFIFYVF